MSEPTDPINEVAFFGHIHNWSLGEPPRLEIVCDAGGNPVARTIAKLKMRRFHVTVQIGADGQHFCMLNCTLPLIASCVSKFGKNTKVKLDVDPNEIGKLLDLLTLDDKLLKWIFTDEGEHPATRRRASAQSNSQPDPPSLTAEQQLHGRMWSALIYKRGFCNAPGVREALEDVREMTTDQPADLLHRLFAVEHMRDVTAARAIERFVGNQAAKTMIEQALRVAGEVRGQVTNGEQTESEGK